MSKSVEETRRELFEALWAKSGMEKFKETAWWAFNAALDAVVIELPGKSVANFFSEDADHGYVDGKNNAIDDCRAAIESTGLGIKTT